MQPLMPPPAAPAATAAAGQQRQQQQQQREATRPAAPTTSMSAAGPAAAAPAPAQVGYRAGNAAAAAAAGGAARIDPTRQNPTTAAAAATGQDAAAPGQDQEHQQRANDDLEDLEAGMETWAVKKPKRALQALSETAAPTPRRKRARPQSSSSDPLNGFEDASFLRLCGPVSVENALEYFARSPFYDPSCNNERLRARNLESDALVFMKGVEFSLYEASFDHLFIILKQRRFSSTLVQRLAAYYILDNRIYEAPALRSLLASRLGQCAMHLEKAVTKMAEIHAATPDRPVPPLLRIGPTSGGLSGGGSGGGGGLGTPHGSSADLDVSRRMRSDSLARGPSSPLHPSVHTVSSLAQQPAYQHQQYYSPHQQHHQQPQRRLGPPMLKRARSVDDQVKGLLHVVVSKFLPANIVPGNISSRPSTAHRSSHGLSTPTND